MQLNAKVQFPQCYKMLIQSFTDWTQWLSVFQKGKEYLWGFLDACSMSDDAPQITMWSWQPVNRDSGDVILTKNSITNSYADGFGTATIATYYASVPALFKDGSNGAKTRYFYNYPGKGPADTGCLIGY